MAWHLQPTRITARLYAEGKRFEDFDPFQAVAQVDLHADGTAFIHAVLRGDGKAVTPRQWRDLALLLRDSLGVKTIQAERHHRLETWSTERA